MPFRNSFSLPNDDFPGFNLIQHRFDRLGSLFPAFLGFTAIQGQIGLDQFLGKVCHRIENCIRHIPEQWLGNDSHHAFCLLYTVIPPDIRENKFFSDAQNSDNNSARLIFAQKRFFAGDNAVFQYLN